MNGLLVLVTDQQTTIAHKSMKEKEINKKPGWKKEKHGTRKNIVVIRRREQRNVTIFPLNHYKVIRQKKEN